MTESEREREREKELNKPQPLVASKYITISVTPYIPEVSLNIKARSNAYWPFEVNHPKKANRCTDKQADRHTNIPLL